MFNNKYNLFLKLSIILFLLFFSITVYSSKDNVITPGIKEVQDAKQSQPLMKKALDAIHETEKCINTDKKECIKQLKLALKSLKKAKHNKGGHRGKAITLIKNTLKMLKEHKDISENLKDAKKEIEKGIKFAEEKLKKSDN